MYKLNLPLERSCFVWCSDFSLQTCIFLLAEKILIKKIIIDHQQNSTATYKNYLLNCVALCINFFGLFLRKKGLTSYFPFAPKHTSSGEGT